MKSPTIKQMTQINILKFKNSEKKINESLHHLLRVFKNGRCMFCYNIFTTVLLRGRVIYENFLLSEMPLKTRSRAN